MLKPNDLWGMGTHEIDMIDDDTQVQRVPGGWIYTIRVNDYTRDTSSSSSVFVPYISRESHARQGE